MLLIFALFVLSYISYLQFALFQFFIFIFSLFFYTIFELCSAIRFYSYGWYQQITSIHLTVLCVVSIRKQNTHVFGLFLVIFSTNVWTGQFCSEGGQISSIMSTYKLILHLFGGSSCYFQNIN